MKHISEYLKTVNDLSNLHIEKEKDIKGNVEQFQVNKPHHIAYEVMKSLGSIYCTAETVEDHDTDNILGWKYA